MSIRNLLFRYFLPITCSYLLLSLIGRTKVLQEQTYPIGEYLVLHALSHSQKDMFFGADRKTAIANNTFHEVAIFFNSKAALIAEKVRVSKEGGVPQYLYHKSTWAIDSFFIAPLLLFFSLLLFSPGRWSVKSLGWGIGNTLIVGFAYMAIRFRGYYLVATAGIPDLYFSESQIKWYQFLQTICSSVTIITFTVLIWLFVLLQANTWQKLLSFPFRPHLQ